MFLYKYYLNNRFDIVNTEIYIIKLDTILEYIGGLYETVQYTNGVNRLYSCSIVYSCEWVVDQEFQK